MTQFASSAQSIFPSDTATKLIESLTGVISANMPIIATALLLYFIANLESFLQLCAAQYRI